MSEQTSCSIFGRVRNRETGELTDKTSELHKNLLGLCKICPTWDRAKANTVYCLTQTNDFLSQYEGTLIFDENGEPTLASLWEAVGGSTPLGEVTHAQMQEVLAKKFDEGHYSYEDAMSKATQFNQDLSGANTFMGLVSYDVAEGSYKFSVVPNTNENQRNFYETVKNKEMYDLIVKRLAAFGIGIDTLYPAKQEKNALGKYNTVNPRKLENGILGIISLSSKADISTLTDEVGHFIIGGLGENHPLVKRLEKILNSDKGLQIAQQLFSDPNEAELTLFEANTTRELMGHLVADFIRKEISKSTKYEDLSAWKNILSKIKNAGIKLFQGIYSTATFYSDRSIAERTARKLAKDFLGGHYEGTIENALNVNDGKGEVLYSNNKFRKEVKEIIQNFGVYLKKLESFGETEKARLLKNTLREYIQTYNENLDGTTGTEAFILEVINPFTQIMLAQLHQMDEDLNNLTTSAEYNDSGLKQSDWNVAAVTVRRTEALGALIQEFKKRLESDISKQAIDMSTHNIILTQISNLEKEQRRLEENARDLRNRLVTAFLTEVNGSDAFFVPTYRGWFNKKGNSMNNIADYLDSADIGLLFWPERFLYAMSSHNYVINQLCEKAVSDQKHKADIQSMEFLNRIRTLWGKYQHVIGSKVGLKNATNRFYERVPGKGLSGNFVQELHWGKWEQDKKEKIKELRKAFIEENVGEDKLFGSVHQALSSREWYEYKTEHIDQWHAETIDGHPRSIKELLTDAQGNAITNPVTGKQKYRWKPSIYHYKNPQWEQLSGKAIEHEVDSQGRTVYRDEQGNITTEDKGTATVIKYDGEKGILQELLEMKSEIDQLLPPGVMPNYRVPQHKGDVISNIANAYRGRGPAGGLAKTAVDLVVKRSGYLAAAAGVALGSPALAFGGFAARNVSLKYLKRSTADRLLKETGAEGTYVEDIDSFDEEEDNIYNSQMLASLGSVRSIPLYGTTKLSDMAELSTDPFGSLVAHAHMCYSYSAMMNTVNLLECVKSRVEKDSAVGSVTRGGFESRDSKKNKVLSDLEAYLNRHVYNLKGYQTSDTWYNKKYKFVTHIMATFARSWARATSLLLLGGNWVSARVNLQTAGWEIFKVALRGEKFNIGDWLWAHFTLAKHLAVAILSGRGGLKSGEIYNKDKMFLLAKRLNFGKEIDYNNFNFSRRMHFVLSLLSVDKTAMMPYSLTDFGIQALSYLAAMHHTKVYKMKDGKIDKSSKTSLWEAFKVRQFIDTSFIDKQVAELHGIIPDSEVQRLKSEYKSGRLGVDKDKAVFVVSDEDKSKYILEYDDDNIKIVGTKTQEPLDNEAGGISYREQEYRWGKGKEISLPKYVQGSKDAHEVYLNGDYYIYDDNIARVNQYKNNNAQISNKIPVEGIDGLTYIPETNTYYKERKDNNGKTLKHDTYEIMDYDPNSNIISGTGKYVNSIPTTYKRNLGDVGFLDQHGYVKYDLSKENEIMQSIKRINSKMHGLYADSEQGRVASSILGPIFLNMRKYAIGLLETGFATNKYSVYDREQTEGFSITALKVLVAALQQPIMIGRDLWNKDFSAAKVDSLKAINFYWSSLALGGLCLLEKTPIIKDLLPFGDALMVSGAVGASALGIVSPNSVFGKILTNGLKEQGFSSHQIANYRNAAIQIALISYLRNLCGALEPPEEDELEKYYKQLQKLQNKLPDFYEDAIKERKEKIKKYIDFRDHPEKRHLDVDQHGKQKFWDTDKYDSEIKKIVTELFGSTVSKKSTKYGLLYEYEHLEECTEIVRKALEQDDINSKLILTTLFSQNIQSYVREVDKIEKQIEALTLDFQMKSLMPKGSKYNPVNPATFGKSREPSTLSETLKEAITGNGSLKDKAFGLAANLLDHEYAILNDITGQRLAEIVSNIVNLNSTNPNWIVKDKRGPWYGGGLLGSIENFCLNKYASEDLKKEFDKYGNNRDEPTYIEFWDYEAEKPKRFRILAPGSPIMHSLQSENAFESPFNTKGSMYYFALRSYMEQTSELNISSFMQDPMNVMSEIFSLSNIAPSLALVNTVSNIRDEALAAYGDPFVRNPRAYTDSKGYYYPAGSIKQVWVSKKDEETGEKIEYQIPCVKKYFKQAYYSETSNWAGQPKYIIDLYGKIPFFKSNKALSMPRSAIKGYFKSRQTTMGIINSITAPIYDKEGNPVDGSLYNAEEDFDDNFVSDLLMHRAGY